MKQKRMSQHQKFCRREARRNGASAIARINNAISYAKDAAQWAALAERSIDETRASAAVIAKQSAEASVLFDHHAYKAARRACYWAVRSLEDL